MYTVMENYIDVLGWIWQPTQSPCSLRIALSKYDTDNMKDDKGETTRQSIEDWLSLNAGDFQAIIDFHAVIDSAKVKFPWTSEETEMQYLDTIGGEIL